MNGHVRKRRDRYYVDLELDPERDPESGARIRRRVGAGSYRTKKEADQVLRDALEQARRGWRGPSRFTLSQYLRDEWLPGVSMELAQTTAALYRTLMEAYVIPRIGGIRIDSLSSADLTNLYGELLVRGGRGGRPLKPKTVRHVHTTLRKALADAVEARHVAWNPAATAKAPRVRPTKDPAAWDHKQLAKFLHHIAMDRLAALWILAASTGMRRGELLGLRWRDLDLDAGELSIRQTVVCYGKLLVIKEPKTERGRRTIPIDPRAVAALRIHHRSQAEEKLAAGAAYADQGLVFSDEIGDPLRPDTVTAGFRRHVKAAGLPHLTPHGLRHTFATVGLEAGVDVLYVAELLGHSSPAITQSIYQHTRRDRLAAAAETIGEAILGK
jgi:integrase